MYKANLIVIFVLIAMATLSICTLTYISYHSPVPKGGFKRKFINAPIINFHSFTNETPIKDICGGTDSHYFFSEDTPGKILIIDSSLKKIKYVYCKLEENSKLNSLLLTYVDSPNAYLLAGNIPAIITFNLYSQKVAYHKNKDQNFYIGLPISSTSFILKGYDSSTLTDQIFKKYLIKNDSVQYETKITTKLHDGGISDNGYLSYNPGSKLLIYMNYYYNRFICLDTNLNLIYQSRTIDTFNTSQIKAVQTTLQSGVKSFTPNSPPKFINYQCAIYKNTILVNSLVPADNEKDQKFRNNSVMDMYNLDSGSYIASFYIPTMDGRKLNRFKILGNTFLAIYNNIVVTYKFTNM